MRRSNDYEGRFSPMPFVWALAGALVVVYLFFLAIGGVDPSQEPAWAIAAAALGVLWIAHAWRRLWTGGASPVADRERRGF